MNKKAQQTLNRVREELERNPLWQQEALGQWLCPYCGNMAAVPEDGKSEAITQHLMMGCPSWGNWKGTYIPLKVLQNKSTSILISHSLSKNPVWKIFDEGGNWHCPFCVQGVSVSKEGKSREIKAEIREHLNHCYKFKKGKGPTESLDAMRQMVDRANLVNRLIPRVQQVLLKDPRWQDMAVDGSWICPFCQERMKNIDISTELLRRETAPASVANHLLKFCKVFQKVQVRNKRGELKPPENLVRITNFIEKKRVGTQSKFPKRTPLVQPPPPPPPPSKREQSSSASATGTARLDSSSSSSGIRKLVGESFSLSVDVGEDEPTTWDALKGADGQRVNSGAGESVRNALGIDLERGTPNDELTPPPRTAERITEAQKKKILEEASVSLALSVEDEKTRIQQKAILRARKHLMEMIGPIPRAPGYEFGAIYKPSPSIDGDFFQFFEVSPERIAFACWEVSKPGMDMVPVNRHFLEQMRAAVQTCERPKEVLASLNTAIYQSTDQDTYLSVLLGYLDTTNHRIQVANAGFQPLVIFNQFRDTDLTEIRTNGIVLGSDEGSLFMTVLEEQELELQPQDLVLTFSQGVSGFTDEAGVEVDMDRFRALVREHGRQDASYFLAMADAEYKTFRGLTPIHRDMTLLAIKRL